MEKSIFSSKSSVVVGKLSKSCQPFTKLKWMDGVLSSKTNGGTESHAVRNTNTSCKVGEPLDSRLFSEEIKQTLNTYTHMYTHTHLLC